MSPTPIATTISVIDLATNTVTGTINVALPLGLTTSAFGAEPQNLVIIGTTAYVTMYTIKRGCRGGPDRHAE